MGRGGKGRQERRMLLRIVALLFALGRLAERLASLPHPVRQSILWLLRPGEARARRFVTGMEPELSAFYPVHADDGPDDALELAERFAELGEWLLQMLEDAVFGIGDIDQPELPDYRQLNLPGRPRRNIVTSRHIRWTAPVPDT